MGKTLLLLFIVALSGCGEMPVKQIAATPDRFEKTVIFTAPFDLYRDTKTGTEFIISTHGDFLVLQRHSGDVVEKADSK